MQTAKRPIIISSPQGLIPFTCIELSDLGYTVQWKGETAVGTSGTWNDALRMNLWLRTAHHVYYQLNEFPCTDLAILYRKVHGMPWETVIDPDGYLSVTASVDQPGIRDHRIVNLKCKDAIVDRIASVKRRRPNSGSERDQTVLSVFWKQNRCSISIDTSGEPLSRRGYRKIPLNAPMQETLAAGVVMASRFSGNEHLVNPMCGSGTIAIEAALIAARKAPGLTRSNYGFQHTLLYRESEWNSMVTDAKQQVLPVTVSILASDSDAEAIDAARCNAAEAGVENNIGFSINGFENTVVPEGSGVVIFNPEYGIRLGNEDELVTTYRNIGRFLKQKCGGYRGYIFTGNAKLAGNVGLKSGKKTKFFNGKIDCRLYEYELFRGRGQ
jgi:23S rRNA G2445 N2-methylase RlmL